MFKRKENYLKACMEGVFTSDYERLRSGLLVCLPIPSQEVNMISFAWKQSGSRCKATDAASHIADATLISRCTDRWIRRHYHLVDKATARGALIDPCDGTTNIVNNGGNKKQCWHGMHWSTMAAWNLQVALYIKNSSIYLLRKSSIYRLKDYVYIYWLRKVVYWFTKKLLYINLQKMMYILPCTKSSAHTTWLQMYIDKI